MFCNWEIAPSNGVTAFFVSAEVSKKKKYEALHFGVTYVCEYDIVLVNLTLNQFGSSLVQFCMNSSSKQAA